MARAKLTGRALSDLNALVDDRDMQRCARCGAVVWEGGSRHHRKLRSRGGADAAENLILTCGSGTTGCHGWMHGNPADATALGFIVPSWANPADWPILHSLYGWVLLLPDGTAIGVDPPH